MALDFNTEPYFDDYSAEKDFYRILFRPSYAVQARELTQLQTILQNQVSRFGDHVFKNGSQVIPGSVNVDNKVHFIKLEQFTGTVDITTYIETLKNKIITGETSGVKMRVLDTSSGGTIVDELSVPTLYCKIEGTADDNVTNRLLPGENIVAYVSDNQIATNFRLTEDQLNDISAVVKLTGTTGENPTTYTGNSSSDVLGYATSVDVAAGIYYVDGVFVRNDSLKLYVGRFNNTPSCRVGFKVTEEAVTPEDDESILDNATGSYNFAAPGAHRYKISLSLVKLPLVSTDNIRFVELVRINNGRVQQKVEAASYAELEKTLARRTYDESGNYEVNKFKLSVREHNNDGLNQGVYAPLPEGTTPAENVIYGDPNQFLLVIDPGKAYIQGYEVESTSAQYVSFNKAREINGDEGNHIQRVTEQTIGLNNGNYVEITNMYKAPSVATFEKVYLVKTLQPRLATAVPVVNGSGNITSITRVDDGEGYLSAPTVVINNTWGSGSGASYTASVSGGKITGFTQVSAGSGYDQTHLPEIRLTSNINVGLAPTASDIVGTARVKSIQLKTNATSVTGCVYRLGLFDIQMFNGNSFERDVKSFIGVSGAGNFSANVNPTYVQLSGIGSTSGNTIVGSGTLFSDQVKAGDIVYLNDTKIGTVSSVSGNYTINLTGSPLASVTNGRITIFTSTLVDPQYETLLFPTGQTYVKTLRGLQNGSDVLKNTTVVVRRQFATMNTSTSNKAWFELTNLDETFLSDADLSNYLLVNADSLQALPLTESMISFDNDSNRRRVDISYIPNGTYYLIASVQLVASAGQEKLKVLNTTGDMTITDKRVVSSSSIDLNHGDIFKLVSVHMTPGNWTYDENVSVDITDRYTLDNGQRSTHYTYGKILLKPGYQVPSGAIRVKYQYFTVNNSYEGNYFSVDSYLTANGVNYDQIPSFFVADSKGKKVEVSLTDVIDFRPILTTTNPFYPQLPKIGSDMIAPRANYVGRIDKVVLDSFGKFNTITGVPGYSPKEPDEPKEGLVLATVAIPPYTKNIGEIIIKQRDNRRYTMRDIGKLERRIANLEYYVTLSLLEKDTATMQVIDNKTGLDRFKNGFIVDQFTGHGIGDVQHQDYRVSIDFENRILRPSHYTNALDIVENLSSGTERANKSYQKTGDLVTLPYTEYPYIFNNNATRTMDIHAISMGAFKGQVSLYPESDNWKSIARSPDLVRVDDNNYDAIKYVVENVIGTKWNEWQTNWTSSQVLNGPTWETRQWNRGINVTGYQLTVTNDEGYQTRSGVTTTVQQSANVNTQSYGDRVVDMSYIPYMRSRPVTFTAKNLKGKTRFWAFFDGIPVSEYVVPADKFLVTRVGNSLMNFDQNALQNNILADDPRRAFKGSNFANIIGDTLGETGLRVEPAFGIGDVVTNTTHNAVSIAQINNLASAAATFTIVVPDSSGIKPGNHVVFYNMDYHNAKALAEYNDFTGNTIPASAGISSTTATSKELNFRTFKVVAVNGGTITLGNIDGSNVQPFSAYATGSYTEQNRGKLYRLKASGVVSTGGVIYSSDTIGVIQQEISIVNINNGFAVGETLTGSVAIGTSGSYNGFTVNEINGSTSVTTAPTMNTFGSKMVTDTDGTISGVFYIPNTDALAFRTGERTFKLTDNQANSDASFDSIGSVVYYAQGIALDKERTIVSTRPVEFVQSSNFEDSRVLGLPPVRRSTTNIKTLYQYTYDPLAQTFTVNNPGGVFLTSIDLYFAEAGRRPISIELRNTDNGVPSSTKTIPLSRVTHTTDEIKVSDDSSVATTFKFKSPIYLQDTETYSFVVMTDEPGAQLYVSEMGQQDIITKNTIAGQPLTGSLYASQNAREWEIHTLLDIKFVMNAARFNTQANCELYLKALPPEVMTLPTNPLHITKNSSKIRVYAPNHGLLAGESVTLSGFPAGLYGAASTTYGIPDTLLNATHTVFAGGSGVPSGLEKDSFIINLTITDENNNSLLKGTTANFISGDYGGTSIRCTRGFPLDAMYMKTSDLVFPDTKIDYYVKTMSQNKVFGSYIPFVPNNNLFFQTRQHIPALENYATVDNVVTAPLQIRAVLSSANENISPVIDLQQLSAYAISNLINNQTASTINVPEIDTRVLLKGTDIVIADLETQGTGTITSSGSTITGVGTSFSTQIVVGNKLHRKSDNALIGTVASFDNTYPNTILTLTGSASNSITNGDFYVKSDPNMVFENITYQGASVGQIRTNIDTADNLLASAQIGKTLIIANVNGSIDGTYVIKDMQVVFDKSTYAGNTELDTTKIIVDRAFGWTGTMDMITDTDFSISVYDKFVDDWAPYGCHNAANYITRVLALSQAADNIKIMFDANIVNNTNVKIYYKTWTGDINPKKLPWVDTGFVADSYDPEGKFVERTIDIGSLNTVTPTTLAPFNNIQIKIVMKSSNPVYVPKFQNLRILALS
jgi:hypothetical protein